MARPTDYSDEILQHAEMYVELHYNAHKENKASIPTVADLALELGVHRDTIYEWCKAHPEFSDTVKRLNSLQEVTLIENGLLKRFDASVTKLLLSSNHGHKEKSDVTTDGKALPTPILGAATKDHEP